MAKLAALACGAALLLVPAAAPAEPPALRVLAFTKTAAYRHDSIPAALQALRELGAQHGFAVDATEDAGTFTDAGLARYGAVVFLLTTGDVLDGGQQAALERYVRGGGGFAGVHSAADTESGWPWYRELLGARFRSHPPVQEAAVRVLAREASTARLPRSWLRTDEWYAFDAPPAGVHVLARLDEGSYQPGDSAMGGDHPIAWSHEVGRGRAWYTAGGHTAASYAEPLFRAHLLGGILDAAGLGSPRVSGLAATVERRRVSVVLRAAGCLRCGGLLRVRGRTTPLRASAGALRATSAPLPPGRWRVEVSLADAATGLTASAARTVTVRRP